MPGVLLILRPGAGLDPLGVVFAVTNVGLATWYHLLIRKLSGSESTVAMLFQTALVGSVFFCIGAVGSLHQLSMTTADFAGMALLGVLATLGHYLSTAKYREAPRTAAGAGKLSEFGLGCDAWLVGWCLGISRMASV